MLLEHIKRYDNDKIIKLVSIDDIRNTNANIVNKIPSVPALMLMPSKELFFGKQAFDILLLPPRGILCKGNSSSKTEKNLDTTVHSDMPNINTNDETGDEPSCFTLNTSSKYSDNFSLIDDESAINNDRNYKWNIITEENDDVKGSTIKQNNIKQNTIISNNIKEDDEQTAKKKLLPSIEDLIKQRDNDIMLK